MTRRFTTAALVVMLRASAHAQPTATPSEVERLTDVARIAARAGRCDELPALATRARALDSEYFARVFATDPVIASCGAQPDSSSQRPLDAVPPLSPARMVGELAFGIVAGGVGAVVAGVIGAGVASRSHGEAEFLGFAIGAVAGFLVAMPAGVYGVGRRDDQRCSGFGALAGSLVGALPGLALAWAGAKYSDHETKIAGYALFVGGPVVGSIVGCNLARRYVTSTPAPMGALVQLRDGRAELGIPLVVRAREQDRLVTTVLLLAATF